MLQSTSSNIDILMDELRWALRRTNIKQLATWGAYSALLIFPNALCRRIYNVGNLIASLFRACLRGGMLAVSATLQGRLIEHLNWSAKAIVRTSSRRYAASKQSAKELAAALKDKPIEAGPRLLTLVLTSLLVSGGPDGDGGAPDLDLRWGIGAHRSPYTHSILLGAVLEAGILSLLLLIVAIRHNLPPDRSPFWDNFVTQAESLLHAASQGVSIGMAYHLLVDGVLQPAPYHKLPLSLPRRWHQAGFVGNATAEAVDIPRKLQERPKHERVTQ